ncbi:MAG: hypothetical protein K1X51_05170 [Rhodospirillaceae bacterium]|nr:hypothetical protein [Rhodospirillaceae bacterium]
MARRRFFVALIFATGVVTGPVRGEDAGAPTGIFSAAATSLSRAYVDHLTVIAPSPDGRSRLVIRAERQSYVLRVEGRIGSLKVPLAYGPNTEVLWSPDSMAFLITENDGGLMGSYLLTVVGQVNGHLTVRHLSKLVATKFGHPVRCFEPESPNVVGLTWLGSSRELVAVAEIVPHSNCDSMGTFTAYSVDPWRSRVLNTFTQAEAKERFGSLMGPRLLNASDACGKEPEACYIPQLHPDLKPH